ncbi:MAG: hypothetical protein LBI74_06605 [Synergistaceae bacterium]|nr:hypothetical protein [Synergistaceae bacterium]
MIYKRRDFRRRRHNETGREVRPRYRGGWLTFLSFFVIVVCLIVVRLRNREANIGPMILSVLCVAAGCFIMFIIARRNTRQ